jgi:capsular exopolysaccharide synthesis family protein
MGRIDEALRRAAGGKGGNLTPPAPTTNPGTEVFTSPWDFNEDAAQPARDANPAEAASLLTPTLPPGGSRRTADGKLAVFRGFHQSAIGRIVAAPGAPAGLSEQFRRLAALLHHAQLVQGTKIILITSANPGDGKTLTATNLALTLSESYRRNVLLIDADLRRPSLHELFDVPNVHGLNDGLKATRESKLAVLQISETLTLLPAGRPDPDPMSTLTSMRMREVLAESAVRFDWVIVDTPPLGLLTDASLLSTMVDGALVVVRANRTPYADVVKTVDAIGRDRLLGVVLNAMDPQSPDRAYDRYYGGEALTAPARED